MTIAQRVTEAIAAIGGYGSSAKQRILTMIPLTQKGAANGVATLGADGKVPAAQLPSYVDDVLEFPTKADFPATGESGKIYVNIDKSQSWRWSGSAYINTTEADLGISRSVTTGSNDFSGMVGGYAGIRFTGVDGFLRDDGNVHEYYRVAHGVLWSCDNAGVFITKGNLGTDSDERLKTNWREIDGAALIAGLAKVKTGVYDRTDIEATQAGASAQSARQVPGLELTVHEKEDGHLALAYGQAAFISAVKLAERAEDQTAIIGQQNQTISEMMETINDLQERLAAVENK